MSTRVPYTARPKVSLRIKAQSEVTDHQDHRKQLPPGDAVVSVWATETAAIVGHHSLSILPPLREYGPDPHVNLSILPPLKEYGPDPHVTGISVHEEWLVGIRVGQDRSVD